MGASGKKGMVHSGREQHAAKGKENGSGKGMHAATSKTHDFESHSFSHSENGALPLLLYFRDIRFKFFIFLH